jgi:hypothetical protein
MFFCFCSFSLGEGSGGAVSVLSSQFIIGSWIWTDSLNCDFIFHDYLFMCKFFAQMEWFSVSEVLFWCVSLCTIVLYLFASKSLSQVLKMYSWVVYSLNSCFKHSFWFPLKKGTKKLLKISFQSGLGQSKLSQGSVMIHPSIGSCLSSVISLQQIPQKQNLQIFLMVKESSPLLLILSLTDIKTLYLINLLTDKSLVLAISEGEREKKLLKNHNSIKL